MFQTEHLQEKWQPVLAHPDLPEIKDSYKRAVTTIILENQEKSLREDRQFLGEAAPTNSSFGGNASLDSWDPILISLVRRSMPNLIAYDICGVQPMTGPTGLIFAMKSRYKGTLVKAGQADNAEALFNEAEVNYSGDSALAGMPSDPSGLNGLTDPAEGSNPVSSIADSAAEAAVLPTKSIDLYTTAEAEQLGVSGGEAFAEMGFTIPACIGAAFAKEGDVIGVTGDGSFMMNLQELQTIAHYNLPVKLFVWNNDGYLSIRTTQKKFFEGREIGTDKSSGVSIPNIRKVTESFGIEYALADADGLEGAIRYTLDYPGPVVCEVFCERWQEVVPTLMGKKNEDGTITAKPLEDMYPFLSREEFYDNMIVEPLD